MKTLYQKISKAKDEIKNTKLTKSGKNNFNNQTYFSPEQVEILVYNACMNNGLLTKFDLKRNEFGEYGILKIIDINTELTIDYEIATLIPEIKGANITQQLGGCVTYTERYLKMSAFGIVENSNDFDDKDNIKKQEQEKPKNPPTFEPDGLPWLSEKQKEQVVQKIRTDSFENLSIKEAINKLYSEFRIRKTYKEEIENELNSNFNQSLNK